ncbi:MAG: hypothetical protein IT378_25795 [Sandaracinaceae bacterium]|nr:hypothetical protein [Sandaracinaceae bacterium]
MKPPSTGRFELAASIALSSGWWVVGAADPEAEAERLASELEAIDGTPVRALRIESGDELVRAARERSAEPIVLVASGDAVAGMDLDGARSRLARTQPAVLVIPASSVPVLTTAAPHFASWTGNQVVLVEEDRFLADAARDERLRALRAHYQLDDDALIAKAERGEAPADAEVAEWLVLLGRPDLVGREPR